MTDYFFADAYEFLAGRARRLGMTVRPLPWSRVGPFYLAATVDGTSIRVLVDARNPSGGRGVDVAEGEERFGRTYIILRPRAGRLSMLRGWQRAVDAAVAMDDLRPLRPSAALA